MLWELMKECRNYFPVKGMEQKGTFTAAEGVITGLTGLLNGQYYIIEGSIFNDGLHQIGDQVPLADETFKGRIVPLAVPRAFLELAGKVDEWVEKYGEMSPIVSESFAGYSYNKTVGSTGKQLTWKDAFATDLAIWRRL